MHERRMSRGQGGPRSAARRRPHGMRELPRSAQADRVARPRVRALSRRRPAEASAVRVEDRGREHVHRVPLAAWRERARARRRTRMRMRMRMRAERACQRAGVLVLSHQGPRRSRVPRRWGGVRRVSQAARLRLALDPERRRGARARHACTRREGRGGRALRELSCPEGGGGGGTSRPCRVRRVSWRAAFTGEEAGVRDVPRKGDGHRAARPRRVLAVPRLPFGLARNACSLHELPCRQVEAAARLHHRRVCQLSCGARSEGRDEAAGVHDLPCHADARRPPLRRRAQRRLRLVPRLALRGALRSRDVHELLSRRPTRPPARSQGLQGLSHVPQVNARPLQGTLRSTIPLTCTVRPAAVTVSPLVSVIPS